MKTDRNDGHIDEGQMRDTYNRDAKAFAEKAPHLMTWVFIGKRALAANLEKFRNRNDIKVLDEGCASGRVVQFLIDEMGIPAKNIDGVELSPEQVKIAQQTIPEVNFRVGNLATIDLPQNYYDLVTRHMVDEHLDNDTLTLVSKNTLGALKPGGTTVIVFTHPDKVTVSEGITQEGKFVTTFPWGDKGWNYFRPIDSYKKILEDAGFVIDSVQGWKIPEDAREVNEKDYEKYKSYGNVRLAVVAHKKADPVK